MHYHKEFTCKRDVTLANPIHKICCSFGYMYLSRKFLLQILLFFISFIFMQIKSSLMPFWNIVAAFRGMHVSPAKHSSASVTDGRTDRQMDGQTDGRTDDGLSAGIYLENGLDGPLAHQVQKTWAGGMGAALGPHWVQGNALVGGSGGRSPPRKYGFLGILKVISCLILIHISPPIWQGIH